jgi:hypothetical protein
MDNRRGFASSAEHGDMDIKKRAGSMAATAIIILLYLFT